MPTTNDPNGNPQKVNEEGQAHTVAVAHRAGHHVNEVHGEAYTWQFSEDPDAGDDCIFYLKNNDDKVLVLEGIDLFITTDTDVYLKVGGTGTTAAGTAITGTNVNAGSGNIADVTCLHDGDIEAGGTFTGATESNRYVYQSGTLVDTHHINFPQDIVIPKNQVFSIWSSIIAVIVTGTLYGYFDD